MYVASWCKVSKKICISYQQNMYIIIQWSNCAVIINKFYSISENQCQFWSDVDIQILLVKTIDLKRQSRLFFAVFKYLTNQEFIIGLPSFAPQELKYIYSLGIMFYTLWTFKFWHYSCFIFRKNGFWFSSNCFSFAFFFFCLGYKSQC